MMRFRRRTAGVGLLAAGALSVGGGLLLAPPVAADPMYDEAGTA